MEQQEDTFEYQVEQFADLQILRYRVPGFEKLSLRQKQLIYYLFTGPSAAGSSVCGLQRTS